ncbi:bifunctional riboflavin kinase/FAD synthetase [Limibacter armeniacum]|uniref:bifunctional riboflavin kinase/FAD synthetase n=1 Tax=Limibacter armeniacum TaxID=466084 RepID=UPI002FE5DC82
MKVYYSIEEFTALPKAVVTSGTFDGVHYGHRKIIERLKEIARVQQAETVMITFWPHPRFVLAPEKSDSLKLLSTLEEKISLLEKLGIDHLIILKFDKPFSQLTSLEFIDKILIKGINTTKLVIGYDHRFGRNREGGFEYLKENSGKFGFEVEEIPKQELEEVAVSSTKIRVALEEGAVDKANHYLEYEYPVTGTVTDGNKLGRTIGYPTANIALEETYKLIPKNGIYAVRVEFEGNTYGGMLNIGNKPTVTDGSKRTMEVNIFDFNQSIYGKSLTIRFVKHLRDEQKFESVEHLVEQLDKDKAAALQAI